MSTKKMKPMPPKSTSVKVVVRCRPLNTKEKGNKEERCVDIDPAAGTMNVRNMKNDEGEVKNYTFDLVYDWNSVQSVIYEETAKPIVQAVIEGFNGTVFAYGQTGTGKTFTMEGIRSDLGLRGVIPNSFSHIFADIDQADEGKQFLVRASYLEIYAEEIRDLLSKNSKQRLALKEKPDTGVYVKDLSSFVTKSVKEIEHVMTVGNKNRSVGATDMNATSSRSHAIFIITVECSETGADGEDHIRVGKLNLVDLAGSERIAKTNAEGDRMKEGIRINQSLSCLGNVIKALVEGGGKAHVPYRDSSLTRLLQDSLGGNAKTVMIANIGPAASNYDETINTLRYANRAKNIKNKPKINEDPKDALLREFQEQINKLKAALEGKGGGGAKKKKKKKKKKREPKFDASGTQLPESSSEEDDDEDGEDEDEEEVFRGERAALEKERQRMMENKSLTEQEKGQFAANIAERSAQLESEHQAKQELSAKIAAMESKLLRPGGKTIVEVTAEQEEQLAQQRRDLETQREKEQKLQERLRKKRADKERHNEEYTSKQEEADHKSKKLKKLFKAFKEARREIEALQQDFTHEREVLSQSFADLQQDLKLRQLIIEHFVPPEEVAKIQNRAVFDEASEEWTLKSAGNQGDGADEDAINTLIARPITAMPGGRHAVSEDAKMRAMVEDPTNPRYRAENIYLVELDMPDRTTQDYVGPMVDPHVAAALEDALRDEEDMTLDADPEDFLDKAFKKAQKDQRRAKKAAKNGGQPPPSRSRPKTGSRPAPQDRSSVVPQSRTGGRKGRFS